MIFKKNKSNDVIYDKNESSKTSKSTSKAKYKVVVKEKFGTATTTLKTITADRYIDPDDHVVYLMNKGEKFLELMPQDDNDFENLNEKTIDKLITQKQDEYNKEQEKDDPDINDKNILWELMMLKAKKRACKYNIDSAYITLDEEGTKIFYFLREGSTFYPFKWDVDNKTVYVANEHKKKKAGIARRNKSLKYSKFKNTIEGSVMFLLIIGVILSLGNGYVAYKFFGKFDESNIVEIQNYCVQKGAEWTEIVERNAKASETILENMVKTSEPRDRTIIDSMIPTVMGEEG